MEHQMESYPSARYMIQQFLQQIKEASVEELPRLISILNTEILRSGWKLESQKEMLIDKRLTYINAQLLVINLCVSLNKEMQTLGIDGVNFLESEKQLESRISCLKEMLIKLILKHTKKTG